MQGTPNNYETDLIFPIVQKAAKLAGIEYAASDAATKTSLKVIGDHIRAVTFLISDGVTPSNVGRGYIVRRLIRRVVMKVRVSLSPSVQQRLSLNAAPDDLSFLCLLYLLAVLVVEIALLHYSNK